MSTPESNGRPPVKGQDAQAAEPHDLEAELGDLDDADDDDAIDDDSATGLEVAFTPRQILGGFALIAALILLLRRRRRSQ